MGIKHTIGIVLNGFVFRRRMASYKKNLESAGKSVASQRKGRCHCSKTTFHKMKYPDQTDYFYKKLPMSRVKIQEESISQDFQGRAEDYRWRMNNMKHKDFGRQYFGKQGTQTKAKRPETKSEAAPGVIRQLHPREPEAGVRQRLSLRRVTIAANGHHLPRVPSKPRSLSAASYTLSSSPSPISGSRRIQVKERASSTTSKISATCTVSSFSPSSPRAHHSTNTLHRSKKQLTKSTSCLLASSAKSLLLRTPSHNSQSSIFLPDFPSVQSSLEEDELADEKNRDVGVYLQVPSAIFRSRQRIVQRQLYVNDSPQKASAG